MRIPKKKCSDSDQNETQVHHVLSEVLKNSILQTEIKFCYGFFTQNRIVYPKPHGFFFPCYHIQKCRSSKKIGRKEEIKRFFFFRRVFGKKKPRGKSINFLTVCENYHPRPPIFTKLSQMISRLSLRRFCCFGTNFVVVGENGFCIFFHSNYS